MAEENIFKRAGRRDWPFGEDTGQHLQRLLSTQPFSEMDPQRRPKLEEILLLDTRVRTYKKGELIVRQGDYGTSAFMMLSGRARVVLSPELPERMIGRRETSRKPFFKILAQLWSYQKPPESFSAADLKLGANVSAASNDGDAVR